MINFNVILISNNSILRLARTKPTRSLARSVAPSPALLPSHALLHYAQQQVSVASCECHVRPLGEEKREEVEEEEELEDISSLYLFIKGALAFLQS